MLDPGAAISWHGFSLRRTDVFQIPFLSAKPLTLAIGGMFLVMACSTAADTTETPGAAATSPTVTAEQTAETTASAWVDIELTDAETGELFTLASLKGNVVAIEPFAVWCTNCHVQQDNVRAAYDDLEASGVKFVSLGVEPNESLDRISEYRARRDYAWTFAQSPIELSRAMADIFGPQILAVPSTPLIILDEDGSVVFQDFGFHGPDALRDIFSEFTS
jgi:cytochrome oxidase Cu insertion factor (SCO1/SenC/PrrC family)